MRTVTFSDASIVKILNDSYVCAWINKRPNVKFKDGLYAGKEEAALPNGTAPDNVTSVFAAWDGTVIHAMSGSLDAGAFKKNLTFARDLYDKVYEGVGRKSDAEKIYAEIHYGAGNNSRDVRVAGIHFRLAKELSGIQQWYPTLFEMLFGKECKD